jgi:Ca2+-binding EF-hand superfamily protein
MGIAAIIGIVSSVIQIARSFSAPEAAPAPQAAQPEQKADRLFAELDAMGRGAIDHADLEKAFDRIEGKATAGAEKLFTKLDADGDGAVTKGEFTGSVDRLADQLDRHYMRLRLHGGNGPQDGNSTVPAADAGFTRDELGGLVSGIAGNFDRADANGDGRVSLREMRVYAMNTPAAAASPAAGPEDNRNVEMMLQVVRLMQAYGIVGGTTDTADGGAAQKVSDQA